MRTLLEAAGRAWSRLRVIRRYRDEIHLLSGLHRSTSGDPSILHFTVERAASRFVGSLMHDLARDAGLTPIDLDGYFFQLGRIEEWMKARGGSESLLYRERGYHYGPFRTSNDHLLDRDGFRILISLRDPRDVLVSLFHNYAYERPRPLLADASHLRARASRVARYQEQSIDDFALEMFAAGTHLRATYEAYCPRLTRPNVLFVKYEDMVADFDAWLARILNFFEFEPTGRVLRRIRRRADFRPEAGTPKRQVTPGDHRRKLAPATVEALTTECRPILECLDYSLGPEG